MTRHEAKCPVTAQELRKMAAILEGAGFRQYPRRFRQYSRKLRELADWLETYDPEQLGEAMELLPRLHPSSEALDGMDLIDRKRALLAKVKGE